MNIQRKEVNGQDYALIHSQSQLISDVQSALDLMMTVQYETGCSRIAISKEAFPEEFFQLSTRLAGEILQKFVTYHIQIAIIGDFSKYTSKALRDFIYESNQGHSVFFVASEEEAAQKLCRV